MATLEDRIADAIPAGWERADYLLLAMAALDQAGISLARRMTIAKLLNVCIDCQLADAEVNDRCEPCCALYDADRLELARDMEIDRRIDEARGK